ncbi:MAG TPA: hypothetical protein VHX61_16565 [Rhizomicrobium sp.]|nr:hypothetical protein [Rhizomicrobium sp.]
MSDENLVVIPIPANNGGVTYARARLVSEDDHAFAEAIVAVPDTLFAPRRRIAPSTYSLVQIRPGSRGSVYLRGNDFAALL